MSIENILEEHILADIQASILNMPISLRSGDMTITGLVLGEDYMSLIYKRSNQKTTATLLYVGDYLLPVQETSDLTRKETVRSMNKHLQPSV